IRELKIEDKVILTGPVSEIQLYEYYSKSKCFISFSEHEGFGVPLLEAAQHGIPVLAFNEAAVSETLECSPGVFSSVDELYKMVDKVFTENDFRKKIINHQENVLKNNSLQA
ncbi:TPA: glycosyltransferase, partial [Citrobacter braakii]